MPTPQPRETISQFVSRYMGSPEAQSSFPNPKQRDAVANAVWHERHKAKVPAAAAAKPSLPVAARG